MMLPPTALPSRLRVEEPVAYALPREAAVVAGPRRSWLFGLLPGLRSTASEPCRHELASNLESKA
jgi:hypothetical protein